MSRGVGRPARCRRRPHWLGVPQLIPLTELRAIDGFPGLLGQPGRRSELNYALQSFARHCWLLKPLCKRCCCVPAAVTGHRQRAAAPGSAVAGGAVSAVPRLSIRVQHERPPRKHSSSSSSSSSRTSSMYTSRIYSSGGSSDDNRSRAAIRMSGWRWVGTAYSSMLLLPSAEPLGCPCGSWSAWASQLWDN